MKKEMINSAKEHGRKYLNDLAIGVITAIMGDLSTSAKEKVVEVNRTLRDLDIVKRDESLPWDTDAKKPLLQTGAEKEISQVDCTIDVSKVESLVDFPLIERGPDCSNCKCFNCSYLSRCHISLPSTLHHCAYSCGGMNPVKSCEYADKENR